jgi:hypothetical protein
MSNEHLRSKKGRTFLEKFPHHIFQASAQSVHYLLSILNKTQAKKYFFLFLFSFVENKCDLYGST